MHYWYAIVLVLVLLLAMFAARVQAGAPDWLVPPGGTVPPEPVPQPGSVDSNCVDGMVTIAPRWFLPIVRTP